MLDRKMTSQFLAKLAEAHGLVNPAQAEGIKVAASSLDGLLAESESAGPPFAIAEEPSGPRKVVFLIHNRTGGKTKISKEFAQLCRDEGLVVKEVGP